MSCSFSDKFKTYLLNTFKVSKPSSGHKNVLIRCKYCPDSDNPNNAHMSINLGYDDNPIIFN